VHPDDRAVTRAALASCTKSPGQETLFEYRLQTRQGDYRYLEAVAQGLVSERGDFSGVLLTARDITERKAMEQELRMLNEHLEQRVAARTADLEMAMVQLRRADQAKDAFMAAVSHELRTPLMGVLGMTELLLEQPDGLSGRQAHYAATIHASGERLLTLVNSILSYTSLVSGRVQIIPENCHLAELCAISLRSVTARAERKQQHLDVDVSPVDLAIVSDVDGIIQILKKLLDNAVKFTPEGGSVGLKVEATQEGDAVQIVVFDTGIGIPPEKTTMLFQAFSQVDGGLARPFGGVGLGLAYVTKMVEMLGGTIAVASTPGQGSTFTVTLPRTLPEKGYSNA
jgi:signal transduction histidine kinase